MRLNAILAVFLAPIPLCASSATDQLRMQYSSPGTVGTSVAAYVEALPIGTKPIKADQIFMNSTETKILE